MFSHYNLVVAQDRADRIASAGYRINGSTGGEFSAEDIAHHIRAVRKSGGGWLRTLLRKLGFVAEETVAPVAADEAPAKATADVVRVSRKLALSANVAQPAHKEAA